MTSPHFHSTLMLYSIILFLMFSLFINIIIINCVRAIIIIVYDHSSMTIHTTQYQLKWCLCGVMMMLFWVRTLFFALVTSVFHVVSWCVRGVRLHIKLISIKCFFLLLLMWLGKTLYTVRDTIRVDREMYLRWNPDWSSGFVERKVGPFPFQVGSYVLF